MSEDEPEDNTKPVFYVTGKNYADLVAQTDKHSKYNFFMMLGFIREKLLAILWI